MLQDRLLLLHSGEAFAAIYRSVVAGLERNLSFLAAVSANGGEHFSLFLVYVLSLVTAYLASLGLVLEALFCVEFLFAGGEHEIIAAFLALKGLVLVHLFFLALNGENFLALDGFSPSPLKPTLFVKLFGHI
jgi:hypothetical protein